MFKNFKPPKKSTKPAIKLIGDQDDVLEDLNKNIDHIKSIPVVIGDQNTSFEGLDSEYTEIGFMGNFYIKENIIGYTGNIDKDPTVYFMREVEAGFESGHITQDHDYMYNIGRTTVLTSNFYNIFNVNFYYKSHKKSHGRWEKRMKEVINFPKLNKDMSWSEEIVTLHDSRSKYEHVDAVNLGTLAEAIIKFPYQKLNKE